MRPLQMKMSTFRFKMRIVLAVISLIALIFAIISIRERISSPDHYLEMIRRTDTNDNKARKYYVDRLVECGPAAIDPIIRTLRKYSPWGTHTFQIVSSLPRFGKTVEMELQNAIEKEKDPLKAIYLIFTYQEAFNDFKYTHYWLENVLKYVIYQNRLRLQLARHFKEDVPDIVIADKINPRFVQWYQKKMIPKGPLPVWRPYRDKQE